MKALILVDIQNDFVPGGALAVPKGDEVVAVANRLMPHFDLVVATQDWHPKGHGSFASTHGRAMGELIDLNGLPQVLWPDHCVQGSGGADFVPGLDVAGIHEVIRKGSDPGIDSYSGFFDNGQRKAPGLESYLRSRGVDEVYAMGLATDYSVKATAMDAVRLGFKTYLILDGCRGVNLHPGDVEKAVEEMKAAGVRVCSAEDLLH
jgi:nicotinamidase/pyrazinamidase